LTEEGRFKNPNGDQTTPANEQQQPWKVKKKGGKLVFEPNHPTKKATQLGKKKRREGTTQKKNVRVNRGESKGGGVLTENCLEETGKKKGQATYGAVSVATGGGKHQPKSSSLKGCQNHFCKITQKTRRRGGKKRRQKTLLMERIAHN